MEMNCAVTMNILNGLLVYNTNKKCARCVRMNEMVIVMML